MIRFLLDGQLQQELPDGWDDLVTSVKVDRTLISTRLVLIDTRLTWYRDGYRYLRDRWLEGPGCSEVEVLIQEDPHDVGAWDTIYRGILKLTAAQWSYEPDRVETSVEDDSFYSYLKNNAALEVNVELPQTKNGEPITPPTAGPWLFNDPLGIQPAVVRNAYLVYDVLAYLVAFLTDHKVQLEAPCFAPGGDHAGYILQTGYRLRTNLTLYEPLTLTLQQVLQELNKNFQIGTQLRFTGGIPTLLVDKLENLNSTTPVVQLQESHPVTVTYDTQRLYASVRVGSTTTLDQSGALAFPEAVRWRGFIEEQYYLLGQCNLDAELDLVRDWVVSSNVIEQVVFNLDTSYDEQVFLIAVLRGTTTVNVSNWLLATPGGVNYYNEPLTNENVVRRWLGGMPSSLASELGSTPSGRFQASKINYQGGAIPQPLGGVVTTNLLPITFPDDSTPPNFDVGNVYNTTTNRFTAPAPGVFQLSSTVSANFFIQPDICGIFGRFDAKARLVFRRYDAGNTLLQTINGNYLYINSVGRINLYQTSTTPLNFPFTLQLTHEFALNVGDYVTVSYEGDVSFLAGSCFLMTWGVYSGTYACTRTTDFGDFTQQVDQARNLNLLVKFRAPLTRPELRALLGNPSGAVDLTTNGRSFRGWLENLKYDHGSNLADFTLLTSQNLLPK